MAAAKCFFLLQRCRSDGIGSGTDFTLASPRAEREKHPLSTLGNTFFFSATSTLISLATLAVIFIAAIVVIRQLLGFEVILR